MKVHLGLAVGLLVTVGGDAAVADSRFDSSLRLIEASPIVWIESGWFWRGADAAAIARAQDLCLEDYGPVLAHRCANAEALEAESPRRRVWVTGFGIDRTEVSNAAYRRCTRAFACGPSRLSYGDPRVAAADHPVAGVTWQDAQRYCRFVGGRLPSEAEWERAARGPDSRDFPWGWNADGRRANHSEMGPFDHNDGYRYAAPVAVFPSGISPWGLHDMAGNVWEWTADRWDPEAYRASGTVDPRGPPAGGQRVVRGGSWRSPRFQLRVTHRRPVAEGTTAPDVGFRCAYDRD